MYIYKYGNEWPTNRSFFTILSGSVSATLGQPARTPWTQKDGFTHRDVAYVWNMHANEWYSVMFENTEGVFAATI